MAKQSFSRHQRVAQQLQRALSELIRRDVRDPRLGMVTLTEVRMAADLSYARIFYSTIGGDESKAQDILDSAADMLRGPAGRALGIRHSPELRFVRDELIQSGARMSALISNAVKEDAVRHVDDPQQADASSDSPAGAEDDDDNDDTAPDHASDRLR